jgi:creatinine amidohydrolase/Fe(II)-dependent formamide hydrolase-like protein
MFQALLHRGRMPRPLGPVALAVGLAVLIGVGPAPAQLRSVAIEDLTWPEVRDAIAGGKRTALIAVGSTEQNGPHMALGKHDFIARWVAEHIALELGDALVYPVLPYAPTGDPIAKTGHMRFPGSVNLAPATFEAVVKDVASSAISAGFTEVYVYGDHGGGQDELARVAAELDRRWRAKGVRVRHLRDVYYQEQDSVRAYLAERGIPAGTHAGADDTSQLMFLDQAGRWIRRDRLARSDSARSAVTGVDGDPTRATAEMGKVFLGWKVAAGVHQIRTFRRGG